MQSSRDSSVWRTLAVAFGDGLAFGVGVHLTQSAARRAIAKPATGPSTSDFHPRVTGIRPAAEPAAPSLNPTRLEPAAPNSNTILALIDGRFREVGGQIDRRLAELEVKFQMALADLNERVRAELDAHDRSRAGDAEARVDALRAEVAALLAEQRHAASAEMRTLRGQMITVHKEFAETLSRLVDEQISRTVDDRLQPMEQRLQQAVREELRTASETAASALRHEFDAKVQGMNAELAAKDRQVAELRRLVEEHDHTVLDLVVSLGQSCLQAAERISMPVAARLDQSPPALQPNVPEASEPPAQAVPGCRRERSFRRCSRLCPAVTIAVTVASTDRVVLPDGDVQPAPAALRLGWASARKIA